MKKIIYIPILFLLFIVGNELAYSQSGTLEWGTGDTRCTTNTITNANANMSLGVQPLCTGGAGGNATLQNGVNTTVTFSIIPSPGTNPVNPVNPVNAGVIASAACTTAASLLQSCPGIGLMPPPDPAPGLGNNFQYMSMNATTDNCAARETVTVVFDPPVTNPSFTIGDIDSGNGGTPPTDWQDLVIVRALDENGNNVSASSVTLGGANVAQVTAGTDFPGSPCPGSADFACPANTTCFRGIDETLSSSAASNATLTYSGNISSISLEYTAGEISNGNNPSAQFVAFGPISWTDTLPVTLSSFSSSYAGGGLQLDWSTSTETSNIGFNIYAYIEGEKVRLNDQIIQSHSPDSVIPQFYEEYVELPGGVTQLGISSVDINGHEDHFGPYEIGASFGTEPEIRKIEWNQIREKYNQKMAGKGFEMRAGKMRSPAPENGLVSGFIARVGVGDSPVCNVAVSEEGMQRVRMRDLRRAGCDFRGENIDDIAVTFKGEPVSRRVHSNNGRVRNGTNIFFYGQTPRERDFLYTTENVYQVSVNPALADIHEDIRRPRRNQLNGFSTEYRHLSEVENNLLYSFTNPIGTDGEFQEIDPWYEDFIFARVGVPDSNLYTIPVTEDANTGKAAALKVRLNAVTDFPENVIDHEARIKLNGNDQGTFTAEGSQNWLIEVPVAGSEIVPGNNQLEVELTGALGIIDFVRTDSYGLTFYRPANAMENKLNFQGDEVSGYTVSGFDVKNVQVYAELDGQLYRLRSRKQNTGSGYSVSFNSVGEGANYWASPVSEFNEGVITKADEGDIKNGGADVLILTHPALTGSELDAYESYVSNQGFTTKVANVLNVYDGFGYGMPTPEGIKSYLEYAKDNLGSEYVVIVGGTTTEFPDPAVMESIQYIPTQFELTQDIIYFTPCDGCMADFNGDFVPELKIFRIPSRQVSDTGAVAAKSNNYDPEATALLLAEHTQDQNYGAQLDSVSSVLGGYDVARVYLSEIASENGISVDQAVCVAQLGADCPDCQAGMPCQTMTGFLDQINSSDKRLIMFNGHGSVLSWTFNSLFTNILAEGLTNSEPTLVIPMACYTTYYQDPGTSSLADQLLFNPNGGSVAVSGAATLSSLSENGTFAGSILSKMCDGTTTLADAVFETKQENPGLTDQVINWDLIGNGLVTIATCEAPVPQSSPVQNDDNPVGENPEFNAADR